MLDLTQLKFSILTNFHNDLTPEVKRLNGQALSNKKKSNKVNAMCGQIRNAWIDLIKSYPPADQTNASLVLQYCYSVACLEHRNSVWPYDYMDFSRRVGELWEGFCSAAWNFPNRKNVQRIPHPHFKNVRDTLRMRMNENIGNHTRKIELDADIDTLLGIIGDINMKEDEVFTVDGTPHVIDFKSGFGSNEKGNMLRLLTVGRAYKIWNPNTRLLLLVRQVENNNYLNVLKLNGLWEVHTSDHAYRLISELTGADIQLIRTNIIDWWTDLTPGFITHLAGQGKDLRPYLQW